MKTVVFFNNKGGVGKTTLVYHIAWMFQELGANVVAIDLDPQSNLTSALLPEERIELLWPQPDERRTILGALQPLLDHLGDLHAVDVERITPRLGLVAGDLGLSLFEDRLADAWKGCLDDNPANAHDAFRVMSSFYRAMENAAIQMRAEMVLVDVGPNLGAINRAALIASDFVVVPLAADLFSLQGLRNLGPRLRDWRSGWQKRLGGKVPAGISMPKGTMCPIGYVVLQHAVRKDRPVRAYDRWVARIPQEYKAQVAVATAQECPTLDEPMLATLKHYRSLMPLAQDANKPMFMLTPADGAIGAHSNAVRDCYSDFETLARKIAAGCGVTLPS